MLLDLIPQNLPLHVEFDRSHRDDMAYHWQGRLQGVYKSKRTIDKLRKHKASKIKAGQKHKAELIEMLEKVTFNSHFVIPDHFFE